MSSFQADTSRQGNVPSLDTEALTRHKLTVKEFAGSRAAQERLIAQWKGEVEEAVKKACPLDFFPQEFVLVSWKQLQVILARDGFPKRYEHWSFGQKFASQQVHDTYGLARTYELVLNTDPCVASTTSSSSTTRTSGRRIARCSERWASMPTVSSTTRRITALMQ